MKHSRKKQHVSFKKIHPKKDFDLGGTSLDFLTKAWYNLPYDITVEERVIFIEITERILKAYRKIKQVYIEDENLKKN